MAQLVLQFEALQPGLVDVDGLEVLAIERDQVVDVGAIGAEGQGAPVGVLPAQADFAGIGRFGLEVGVACE